MTDVDPDKLKVSELRDELNRRSLDAKGVKAVLLQRLRNAVAGETETGKLLDKFLGEIIFA